MKQSVLAGDMILCIETPKPSFKKFLLELINKSSKVGYKTNIQNQFHFYLVKWNTLKEVKSYVIYNSLRKGQT